MQGYTTGQPKTTSSFITEVARYFMDFLETDFHKVRNPRRRVQQRNSNNLQTGINLSKYQKYNALVWKAVNQGFERNTLRDIKQGSHIVSFSKELVELIHNQLAIISDNEVEELIQLMSHEISSACLEHPNDITAATDSAIDKVTGIIHESFLARFTEKVHASLEKLSTLNSSYQLEEELSAILLQPLKEVIPTIVGQISLGNLSDRSSLLAQAFELGAVRDKISSFFSSFEVTDLFLEVSELVKSKTLLEKQEFYLYFCDISYQGNTYPLFYIPLQIEKIADEFTLAPDSALYINKKAIQFVSQAYNAESQRKDPLSKFDERIIYLSEGNNRAQLPNYIGSALKQLTMHFGLAPNLDISNPQLQTAKQQGLQLSNRCYIALFDKSDESLINDYEDILQKIKDGDNDLAQAFQVLIDDFITNNPMSIISEVEHEWESYDISQKLVYSSPVPLNEEQRQILTALNQEHCKYITVEGPPGTGKSHTITAIVCDAILKDNTVLVLSDKKEALDVIEDKITETMNKVRIDKHFQNPILRLGKTGNSYAKILSTQSITQIKDHYKAVRSSYNKLENDIGGQITELQKRISDTAVAYEKITLPDIVEYIGLEEKFAQGDSLPADKEELCNEESCKNDIGEIRDKMAELKQLAFYQDGKISTLFRELFPSEQSTIAFCHFLGLLDIAEQLKGTLANDLLYLSKVPSISAEGLDALQIYIAECTKLKSGWLGYLFKGQQIIALNKKLAEKLTHRFTQPHHQLAALQSIAYIFNEGQRLKAAQESSTSFKFEGDFVLALHKLLSLSTELPDLAKRKQLYECVNTVQSLLSKYPKTAAIIGYSSSDVYSLCENKLLQYSAEDFEMLVRYLALHSDLHTYFLQIPEQDYVKRKQTLEELITTQMTYKMDERVISFSENHRNDAKTLAGIISKKQRFDRTSFDKLRNAFPCILAGIRDFAEYIPLESGIFDIVIIDEASQVSIAQAFPALLRGKKTIVLGDKKQFSNVKASHARSDTNYKYLNCLREVFVKNISGETAKCERLEKFNIKTSVLDFFDRISNYTIMLKKHFRGYKELISYSSKYFYGDALQAIKIRAKPISQVICFSYIEHDGRIEAVDNTNQLEIDEIVKEVERISKEEAEYSIGIITPHTNQQKLLVDAFSRHPDSEHFQKHHKLKIMTFDSCQGEERDIILYSMVANPSSDKLNHIFIADRKSADLEEGGTLKLQRLNVGFSRAKERMHLFLSKPIGEFKGEIGVALRHYCKELEDQKVPDVTSTDARSPMEQKVLHWLQETDFFKSNKSKIDLQAQFRLGDYIKQLDRRYCHPAFVVDFLLVYIDENNKEHKIIIEYDGFEYHFTGSEFVNELNYEQYYTEEHVYREKVLESYGYHFLRINRFNIGKDPVEELNRRLAALIKKKNKITAH